jgi:hypothetical protein
MALCRQSAGRALLDPTLLLDGKAACGPLHSDVLVLAAIDMVAAVAAACPPATLSREFCAPDNEVSQAVSGWLC